MRKTLSILSVTVSLLAFGTPADAQDSAAAEPATSDGDIIVTAQRREERLSDVPMTVTAIGGDRLASSAIVSSNDLTAIVPGLLWGRSTNFNQPTIRGIGSRNASAGDEPNVATFIDGVYQPDAIGTLLELSNVERVEVLKGPQGTLFGRNATGGAINIITKKPSFDWTGSASATYGEFGYYKVSGYFSGPLVADKVAIGLSGTNFGDKGYIRNIFLGGKQGDYDGTALRGKLLFEPSEALSISVNSLYSYTDTNALLSTYAINGNSQARLRLTNPAFNPNNLPASVAIASQPFTTSSAFVPYLRVKQYLGDVQADWDLGFATLNGLVSFGKTRGRTDSTLDASAFLLNRTQYLSITKSRNQQLVLTSNGEGMFSWLLGLTGFQADGYYNPVVSTSRNATTGASVPVNFNYGLNTRAVAAFGEATLKPTENLFLTGGLRYSKDKRHAYNTTGATVINSRKSFDNVSPRAVIRYNFGTGSNVYASYTKGFKSGVYNASSTIGAQIPVDPEIVDAYEVGLKARLAPGINAELSAYHYDYSDLQVSSAITFGTPPISTTQVQNAGRAKIDGVEATLSAQVAPSLRLSTGLSWIPRAKIYDFPNAVVQLPITAGGVVTNTGNVATTIVANGKRLIRAPKTTLNLGADFEHEAFGGWLSASANAFFSTRYYADIANSVSQSSYEVVNGSITWRPEKDKGVYFTVFVQNLTDQTYALGYIVASAATDSQANKPRWFGGTIGFEF